MQQADQVNLQESNQELLQGGMHGGQGLCRNVQPGGIDGTQQAQALCACLLCLLSCLAVGLAQAWHNTQCQMFGKDPSVITLIIGSDA